MYMTIQRVESAFRSLKSSLGLRPIHHQKEERTEGHLFISVLAYHLLNTVEHKLQKAGDIRTLSYKAIARRFMDYSHYLPCVLLKPNQGYESLFLRQIYDYFIIRVIPILPEQDVPRMAICHHQLPYCI